MQEIVKVTLEIASFLREIGDNDYYVSEGDALTLIKPLEAVREHLHRICLYNRSEREKGNPNAQE